MAKRDKQRQEAFEAGERNVVPGQSAVAAFLRGLGREISGADMGSPAGQRMREELGSLGYEQALRELYPEDFAQGRAAGSDFLDPLTLLAMRARLPGQGAGRLGGPGGVPRLPSGNVLEGEIMPPVRAIEGPLYDLSRRNAPMSPPVSGFEQNAVRAMQRSRPVPARAGFAYKPEHSATYWEEGGQGFRPSDADFVELSPRRNQQEFYSPSLMDHLAEQMRRGNRGAMRNEYFGPNADRPNYGQVPEGARNPFLEMPRPGVQRRPQAPRAPQPYGEVLPGDGVPFEEMPRPGVQRGVDGRGRLPARQSQRGLRYDPVGPMPMQNLPMMARGPMGAGAGGAPGEMLGEGYEVYGIGGPQQGAGWNGSMDFGVTGGGAGHGGGMPYGRAAAMGIPGAMVAGMADNDGRQRHTLPDMMVGREPVRHILPVGPSFASPLFGGFAEHPLQYQQDAEEAPAARGGVEAGPPARRGKQGLPPVTVGKGKTEAPVSRQGFEPNMNYYVTKALDNMFGTNEAERGRKYQQDVEEYQRRYGPIYY